MQCLKKIGPCALIFILVVTNLNLGGFYVGKYVFTLLVFGLTLPCFSKSIEVMSYNVENLFDTSHDEGHSDYEYLPMGSPAKASGCSKIENDYFRGKCFRTDWSDSVLKNKLSSISDVVFTVMVERLLTY